MIAKNHAADRVRPILKAMERSIEAARSTRTQPAPRPAPAPATHAPAASAHAAQAAPRLKARPKRGWL